MGEKTIYFLFTDTGTYLAKAINYCTKQSLNHVSIAFDHELKEVYSFGRKRPRNPFIGGFVREDIRSDFLKESACAIYSYRLSEADCEKVLRKIKEIEARKHDYKYNFLGLIGVLLRIEIEREHALFCSQFVATVLRETESFDVKKPLCFVTPADIRNHIGLNLIYRGRLGDYQQCMKQAEHKLVKGEQTLSKQSFIYTLSEKVKQFVIR
ncbi:hypothetical protein KK120_05185 [Virgibacillus dakarensis]|uniref:hypothetical protein n=1 Tax=Virgibacillus dakarensis TaxID=1917889 RepID=UPI000B433CA4|nr:hypothetical protein [Virgibacillus dakarensis]MBT2215216.1 hypothetical protein [Virgibacillus dakarensis]